MRILLVTGFYPPHLGGVELSVHYLARELRLLGEEVKIVTSNFPRVYSSESNVVRLRMLCKPSIVPVCPSIFKHLREIKTDVVHIHTPPRFFPEATTFFYKFSKTKVPIVLTNHAPRIERLVLSNSAGTNKYWISTVRAMYIIHNRLIHRWVHRNVQRIIVQGEAMKEELSSTILKGACHNFFRKIRVIPNGVDHDLFDPEMHDAKEAREKFNIREENVIVFVGRLARHKGIDYLLKALQLLKPNMPDLLLVIVGDGIEKHRLERLCQKLDINPNVKFMGMLRHGEIPLILSLASILVHPSFYEGVPTAVLEAMSMAKPVVVTNIGCMPEVVQDRQTGFVVEKENASQLANATLSILSDKKLASRMGQSGRALIEEKYRWNIVAKKHLEVYEEALGEKSLRVIAEET